MGMWQFALYQAVGNLLHIKVRTVAATMIWPPVKSAASGVLHRNWTVQHPCIEEKRH
jgi:hypothetical protein